MGGIEKIIEIVESELSEKEIDKLYPSFLDWVKEANNQGIKAKEKYTVGALKDKTAAEYVETRRALRKYFLTAKKEYLLPHAKEALEEIGDLANMSLILLPYFSDEKIPIKRMIISLYSFFLNMKIKPPYSINFKEKSKEEFAVWLKNIEFIAQYYRIKKSNDFSEFMFDNLSNMIEEEFNKIDRELKYKIDEKNSRQEIVSSISGIINYALLLTSVIPVTYEDFFALSTEKMKQRDKRYHGINRLDEKNEKR